MKNSFSTALAFAAGAAAYPSVMNQLEGTSSTFKEKRLLGVAPGFNAKDQYVSNTGEHAFIAPSSTDVRGPCPGLNAMANHGYLPRSGVGSHLDFISGTFEVFGMSADLSGFLTAVGGVLDGDGLTWSIGGPYAEAPLLGGLLGQPQGISGSHNKYESDASPTRGDLYLYGSDYKVQMDQWTELYNRGQANGDNYTLELLEEFRSDRWDHSVSQNPYFFSGPFTGVLVAPAAFSFIYRYMGNKSEEYPEGYLNGDVLSSFFAMTKNKDGSFTHKPGQERIPDNWYKRAIGDEYGIPSLNLDTVLAGLKYPKFLSVGGNTNGVNTFTGLQPEDLTGGVFNGKNLLEGNNLACFAMQFAVQAAPDLIQHSNVLSDITGAMSNLTSALGSSIASLSCPQLEKIDQSQFNQFPGYAKINFQNGQY